MLIGFSTDFYLGLKQKIFKKKVNNNSVVVENALFLIVTILYAVILSGGESNSNKNKIEIGWAIIGMMIFALISLIYFKVKGKKAL